MDTRSKIAKIIITVGVLALVVIAILAITVGEKEKEIAPSEYTNHVVTVPVAPEDVTSGVPVYRYSLDDGKMTFEELASLYIDNAKYSIIISDSSMTLSEINIIPDVVEVGDEEEYLDDTTELEVPTEEFINNTDSAVEDSIEADDTEITDAVESEDIDTEPTESTDELDETEIETTEEPEIPAYNITVKIKFELDEAVEFVDNAYIKTNNYNIRCDLVKESDGVQCTVMLPQSDFDASYIVFGGQMAEYYTEYKLSEIKADGSVENAR